MIFVNRRINKINIVMCLKQPKEIKTKKDIVCYKVVHKKLTGELVSIFMGSRYILGRTKKLKRNEPIFRWNNYYDILTIEGGAYHTFKYYKDAKKYAEEDIVIKCIIPKNTKYVYEGDYSTCMGDFKSYASERIKPIKIMR